MNRLPDNPGVPPTTDTPLTMSAHIGRGLPFPQVPTVTVFNTDSPVSDLIYHSTFTIKDTMTPNVELFSLKTSKPFPVEASGRVIPINIDQFNTAVTMTTDLEVVLIPVKLPNSPCAIALDRNYTFPFGDSDSYEDPQNQWSYTDSVQLRDGMGVSVRLQPQYNGVMPSVKMPGHISHYVPPHVLLKVRFLNYFVHTNVQPSEFSVLVFLRFTNIRAVGYSLDYIKQNYFLNTQ